MKLPTLSESKAAIVFFVGIGAFIWQVCVEQTDNPTILIIIAGLLGIPLTLKADKETDKDG